ncbi:hypothetical protein GYO_2882 [Bacillus spizizenii TU-B-10]|uniref:Uncharacterized protein n=1 Tax=Bacillus spizizenii (strain DSM 15029 / JCM 12233 / NBRC 101239 / NRRL B-23049 / TU-B-10) TaxID=1052585 RepID=G4NXH1_BACS4|nr:hypothetical protein GYO_2882 [Bacillus spizizenii TU-B-10]GEK27566.1 hypothetical protein BSU04nite_39550 [Bacillus spizizenii]
MVDSLPIMLLIIKSYMAPVTLIYFIGFNCLDSLFLYLVKKTKSAYND